MTEEIAKKEAAAVRAEQWANAGKDAFALAVRAEKAALEGELIQPTPKEIEITIKGALKLFLDGNILDKKIIEKIKAAGLDMANLRKSLVEQTVARAIPQIINSGDFERLAQLGELAGETKQSEDIPGNAKRVVRERITIELED